jgi:hypothetical protein
MNFHHRLGNVEHGPSERILECSLPKAYRPPFNFHEFGTLLAAPE